MHLPKYLTKYIYNCHQVEGEHQGKDYYDEILKELLVNSIQKQEEHAECHRMARLRIIGEQERRAVKEAFAAQSPMEAATEALCSG